MKARLLFTIPFLITTVYSTAQTVTFLPLQFGITERSLFVTPREQYIITSEEGEIAFTNSPKKIWRKSNIQRSGKTIFFNRDTGFIAELLTYDNKPKKIYFTTNAGKTWQKKEVALSAIIDGAWHLDNGEAWLSTARAGFAYTSNYGASWTSLPAPDTIQRFSMLFFNIKHEGLAGGNWNMLFYTKNNGNSWKRLPTPLDQQKYNKTYKAEASPITAVTVYKDHFFVSQEYMVFYSKKDSINWIPIPGYQRFLYDAGNSELYFLDSKNRVVLTDLQFKPTFTFPAAASCRNYIVRNGSLYSLTSTRLLQFNRNHSFFSYPLLSDQVKKKGIEWVGNDNLTLYGRKGAAIYVQHLGDENWKKAFTLPFSVNDSGQLSLFKENMVYQPSADSVYYLHIPTQKLTRVSVSDQFACFGREGLRRIHYITGSLDLSHSFTHRLTYEATKEKFTLTDSLFSDLGHLKYINKDPVMQFDTLLANDLVKELHSNLMHPVTIADFEFSQGDYSKCKDAIRYFQNNLSTPRSQRKAGEFEFMENNINFDRLLSLVDSVKDMNSQQVAEVLLNFSATENIYTDYQSLELYDGEGRLLTISNTTPKPNVLYLPWLIKIDNIPVATSFNSNITRFIKQTCPSLLQETNKLPILYYLVKKLYTP